MPNIIHIDNFTGVITNADPMDIPDSAMVVCKNMRPVNGKLVKTYGYGVAFAKAFPVLPKQIFTYIRASFGHTPPYLGIYINPSTKVLSVYAYISSSWQTIDSLYACPETLYHKNAINPVFDIDNTLRVLPGNVSKADTTHESKGLWLGVIDRDFFDGLYEPGAIFYSYPTVIDAPDIDALDMQVEPYTLGTAQGMKHYKLAYIYDGAQRSLLSNSITVIHSENGLSALRWTITKANHNKRITSIEVYRAYNPDAVGWDDPNNGPYYKIHEIDLTRQAEDVTSEDNGAYSGTNAVYIPALESWDGVTGGYDPVYKLQVGSTYYTITGNNLAIGHIYVSEALPTSPDESGAYCWNQPWSIIKFSDSGNVTGVTDAGGGKCKFACAACGLNPDDVVTHSDFSVGGYNGSKTVISVDASGYVVSATYVSTDTGIWTLPESTGVSRALIGDSDGGAFAGADTLVVADELDVNRYSGGFVLIPALHAGNITAVYEYNETHIRMQCNADPGFSRSATIRLSGFTVPTYNGVFEIGGVWYYQGQYFFNIKADYVSTDTGAWEEIARPMGIVENVKRAIRYYIPNGGVGPYSAASNSAYILLNATTGLYYCENAGAEDADVIYRYIDNAGADLSDEYPLWGEKYIKINGKFARVINGRTWQFDIVIDPGGVGEAHTEWAAYSELGQYDVMPASNVLAIVQGIGGSATGIDELWGMPVFLKQRAIVSIDTRTSPDEPAKWTVKQSIHNLGNIAEQGHIGIGDELVITSYDGLYRLSPNNLAPTDQTPTSRLKITEAIEDTWNLMDATEKAGVMLGYDNIKDELLCTITIDTVQYTWAMNWTTGAWRQIVTGVDVEFYTINEYAQALILDGTDKKMYTPAESEAVTMGMRTRTFKVDLKRKKQVRLAHVYYKSSSILTLNVYAENDSTAVATTTLPTKTTMGREAVSIRYWAQIVSFEIVDSAASSTATEINKIEVEIAF
jgi:hypothetical protein